VPLREVWRRWLVSLAFMIYKDIMKLILITIMLTLSFFAHSDEACDLETIGLDENSDIAEQLFFTGTCHYRNKEYDLSVKSWEKLSAFKKINPEYEEHQIDVLNNLGYMKFYGYGTTKDQPQAIVYWKKAILLGHYEAEYHLCHAYADKDESTYHIVKARKHCEKALLIYKGMDEQDKEIIDTIKKYISQINV
jgi:TPR repeat protein